MTGSDRETCPHCGSDSTMRTSVEFADSVVVEHRACVACGEPYRVEYRDPEVMTE